AAAIEEQVNSWIVENRPVHAVHTTREAAEAMGAMALFGEKYGEWVRMVEVAEVSRELCGGTHVGSAAEVGLFEIVSEGSSAGDARARRGLSDRVRQALGESAEVLGTESDGRVHLVANVAPEVVERGVKAVDVIRLAAEQVGGGGGGRDTMAQAGGRHPEKLP